MRVELKKLRVYVKAYCFDFDNGYNLLISETFEIIHENFKNRNNKRHPKTPFVFSRRNLRTLVCMDPLHILKRIRYRFLK